MDKITTVNPKPFGLTLALAKRGNGNRLELAELHEIYWGETGLNLPNEYLDSAIQDTDILSAKAIILFAVEHPAHSLPKSEVKLLFKFAKAYYPTSLIRDLLLVIEWKQDRLHEFIVKNSAKLIALTEISDIVNIQSLEVDDSHLISRRDPSLLGLSYFLNFHNTKENEMGRDEWYNALNLGEKTIRETNPAMIKLRKFVSDPWEMESWVRENRYMSRSVKSLKILGAWFVDQKVKILEIRDCISLMKKCHSDFRINGITADDIGDWILYCELTFHGLEDRVIGVFSYKELKKMILGNKDPSCFTGAINATNVSEAEIDYFLDFVISDNKKERADSIQDLFEEEENKDLLGKFWYYLDIDSRSIVYIPKTSVDGTPLTDQLIVINPLTFQLTKGQNLYNLDTPSLFHPIETTIIDEEINLKTEWIGNIPEYSFLSAASQFINKNYFPF
jgi:hypothetical protein